MELKNIITNLKIEYELVEHDPVFTASQAQNIKKKIFGIGCKNLFLTDSKKSNFFLVILMDTKQADLKKLSDYLGTKHLSFTSNTKLYEILRLYQGCVSPFGIINDKENLVTIIIDSELKNKRLLFHPNTNTKTISIKYDDLIRFIKYTKHDYKLI